MHLEASLHTFYDSRIIISKNFDTIFAILKKSSMLQDFTHSLFGLLANIILVLHALMMLSAHYSRAY